jgi:hypothetical protein
MGATIRAAVQRINLRAAVLCVIGLIAPVLLMSTFASSAGGAVLFGYPLELGWTLPVSLDLVAVVGTVVASMAVSRGLLAYALALVYIPLAVSWAANGLDHAFRDAFLDHASGWWIWTSVGLAGAPPVALIAVLHMAIKLNKERRLVPHQELVPAAGAEAGELVPELAPAGIELVDEAPTEELELVFASPLVPTAGADLVPTGAALVPASTPAGEAGAGAGDDLVPTEERAILRARELIQGGAGRTTVVRETGLKDHVAKALIREHRPTVSARADR